MPVATPRRLRSSRVTIPRPQCGRRPALQRRTAVPPPYHHPSFLRHPRQETRQPHVQEQTSQRGGTAGTWHQDTVIKLRPQDPNPPRRGTNKRSSVAECVPSPQGVQAAGCEDTGVSEPVLTEHRT